MIQRNQKKKIWMKLNITGYNMKKILITGGLGYIGARISKYLSDNYDIIITTRNKESKNYDWLDNGRVINLDLSSENEIKKACNGIDTIVHLAALNEVECSKNYEKALEVNVANTIRLIKIAEEENIRRFIKFSTAHVYGELKGIINEEVIPEPTHPYAITHRAAEDFVISSAKRMSCIVFRLSNGFGAPVSPDITRWKLLVNDLCKQIITEKKITIKSSGMQKRDFITLHDVCRATEHMINLDEKNIGNGIYNLGGDCTMKIKEMAELISLRAEKILGFKPVIEIKEKCSNEDHFFEYESVKIKKTGFNISRNINIEIDETLLFCDQHFNTKDNK